LSGASPEPEDNMSSRTNTQTSGVRSSSRPQLRGHPEVAEAISATGAVPSRGWRKSAMSRTRPYEAER